MNRSWVSTPSREFRPAATVDLRAGRNIQTYKGNLRLLLNGTRHTNIVEWLQDLAPAPRDPAGIHEAQCGKGATTASTSASTTTTTRKATATTKSSKSSTTSSSTTSTSTAPSTTSTTAFGAPIDVSQQRVVWLIGLDSCRPFTVDAALGSSANLTTVTVLVMN